MKKIDLLIKKLKQGHKSRLSIGEHKGFPNIPDEWYTVYLHYNPKTKKNKIYFECFCGKLFSKSCNIRDHFRKHNGDRPFSCHLCSKDFT